jgi:hypothetical protein
MISDYNREQVQLNDDRRGQGQEEPALLEMAKARCVHSLFKK